MPLLYSLLISTIYLAGVLRPLRTPKQPPYLNSQLRWGASGARSPSTFLSSALTWGCRCRAASVCNAFRIRVSDSTSATYTTLITERSTVSSFQSANYLGNFLSTSCVTFLNISGFPPLSGWFRTAHLWKSLRHLIPSLVSSTLDLCVRPIIISRSFILMMLRQQFIQNFICMFLGTLAPHKRHSEYFKNIFSSDSILYLG